MNASFAAARIFRFVVVFSVLLTTASTVHAQNQTSESQSSLYEAYKDVADRIIAAGRKKNDAYLKLQELCDDIGCRLSGSKELEEAIKWAQKSLKADGQENVRADKVMVYKWTRGGLKGLDVGGGDGGL